MGIERAEEAVNNSVGEAAGEFFQNIGEVPASACSLFLFYTVVVYNVQICSRMLEKSAQVLADC